jgi:hypothetical protein
MEISRWSVLRMRNVLGKSCRENQNTHFISSSFFLKSCRLWDNVEKYGGARGDTNDVTIWRIRVACLISKATCTYAHAHAHALGYTHARRHARAHTYVIFTAFPQQQWFANASQCYVIRTLSVLQLSSACRVEVWCHCLCFYDSLVRDLFNGAFSKWFL